MMWTVGLGKSPTVRPMSKTAPADIPQTAEELTPEWYTTALVGVSGGARVVGVEHSDLSGGLGFVGAVLRAKLTWSEEGSGLPASVAVKLPATSRSARSFAERVGAYEREIVVYRDLLDRVGMRTPRFYYAEMDPNRSERLADIMRSLWKVLPIRVLGWLTEKLSNLPESALRRYVLVVEDIVDARPARQLAGGSVEDALEALTVLAKHHAEGWMRSEWLDLGTKLYGVGEYPRGWRGSYQRNKETMFAMSPEIFTESIRKRMDAIDERSVELAESLLREPWTVLHSDYRLDNILFRENGELVVIDHQMTGWGRPGWDVAYFVSTALAVEHRDKEDQMLHHYHDALVEAGVTDYAYSDLCEDVRASVQLLAHRYVANGTVLQNDTFDEFLAEANARIVAWLD